MKQIKKIIISRTDNLGDVILTLPMAGYLKKYFPESTIYFIGKQYTRALIEHSQHVDHFLDVSSLNLQIIKALHADAIIFVFPDKQVARIAAKARIPLRIGTSHRWWHWLYANRLVNFSRKKSLLHEAQLNFKLFKPLGIPVNVLLEEMSYYYGYTSSQRTPNENKAHTFKLILHPKSKGSAREWDIENYFMLITKLQSLPIDIYITGTQAEGDLIKAQNPEIFLLPQVSNLTGKLGLAELINFINSCDGLIACSTGPLHIAAALGKHVLGLYPPMRPTHPGRWQPIGTKAGYLVFDKENCNDCRKGGLCTCMQAISVDMVHSRIMQWLN